MKRKNIQKNSKESQKRSLIRWYKRPNIIALIIVAVIIVLSIPYTYFIYRESYTVVGEVLSKKRGVGSSYTPNDAIYCLVGDTCLTLMVRYNIYEKARAGDFCEIIISDKFPHRYRLNKRKGFFSKPMETPSFIESIPKANSIDSLSATDY